MSYAKPEGYQGVGKQVGAAFLGALSGAITGKPDPINRRANPVAPATAMQIGSAIGAAAANGAGLSGAAAAGVGVLTAKAAIAASAATAIATAAAPIVVPAAIIGGLGYLFTRSKK
jgi:hypothetical protein